MTKKHFENIAQSVRMALRFQGPEGQKGIEHLVELLCLDFKQANRSFNKDKFLEACGFGA